MGDINFLNLGYWDVGLPTAGPYKCLRSCTNNANVCRGGQTCQRAGFCGECASKTDCDGKFPASITNYECKAGRCIQPCGSAGAQRARHWYEAQDQTSCKSGEICIDDKCLETCTPGDQDTCGRCSTSTCQTDGDKNYCGECVSASDCTSKFPSEVPASDIRCDAGRCRQKCGEDGDDTSCKKRTDKPVPKFTCSSAPENVCVSKLFWIILGGASRALYEQ